METLAAHIETDASFLTVDLKINFLNPAKGDRLLTRAKVLKGGKTLTVVQTDSFIENTESLRQVATALLTFIAEKRKSWKLRPSALIGVDTPPMFGLTAEDVQKASIP